MSLSTRHHARKKAKDLSDEELRDRIEEIAEKVPKMPTHEFDDKRAISKKKTRQKVYREELESRTEKPMKLSPDTSKFEPEPMGVGFLAQVDAFIPDRFLSTKNRRSGSETVSNRYKSANATVDLKVRRERPREDFTESGEDAVEMDRLLGPRKAWWQRAPRPEKVADKLLEALDPPMNTPWDRSS